MRVVPKPDQADAVAVTMDSLTYTNESERVRGAQRVRARSGEREFFSRNIDLSVDRTGPTTGKASFDLTVPADAPTAACRSAEATTCRWVTLESVDAAGKVLNSFYVEVPADGQPAATPSATPGAQPTPSSAPSAAPSALGSSGPSVGAAATASAASGAKAAPSASAAPVSGGFPEGEARVASGGGGHASAASVGAGGLPAATGGAGAAAPEARGAVGATSAGGSGGRLLARTGTSLSAGVVALTLIAGGCLIVRRRRQVD